MKWLAAWTLLTVLMMIIDGDNNNIIIIVVIVAALVMLYFVPWHNLISGIVIMMMMMMMLLLLCLKKGSPPFWGVRIWFGVSIPCLPHVPKCENIYFLRESVTIKVWGPSKCGDHQSVGTIKSTIWTMPRKASSWRHWIKEVWTLKPVTDMQVCVCVCVCKPVASHLSLVYTFFEGGAAKWSTGMVVTFVLLVPVGVLALVPSGTLTLLGVAVGVLDPETGFKECCRSSCCPGHAKCCLWILSTLAWGMRGGGVFELLFAWGMRGGGVFELLLAWGTRGGGVFELLLGVALAIGPRGLLRSSRGPADKRLALPSAAAGPGGVPSLPLPAARLAACLTLGAPLPFPTHLYTLLLVVALRGELAVLSGGLESNTSALQ
jgi:hypothetical protein